VPGRPRIGFGPLRRLRSARPTFGCHASRSSAHRVSTLPAPRCAACGPPRSVSPWSVRGVCSPSGLLLPEDRGGLSAAAYPRDVTARTANTHAARLRGVDPLGRPSPTGRLSVSDGPVPSWGSRLFKVCPCGLPVLPDGRPHGLRRSSPLRGRTAAHRGNQPQGRTGCGPVFDLHEVSSPSRVFFRFERATGPRYVLTGNARTPHDVFVTFPPVRPSVLVLLAEEPRKIAFR